jgi:hypothetical protein
VSTNEVPKKPKHTVTVVVHDGVPQSAVDLLRSGTSTLESAENAERDADKAAFAAARKELEPYRQEAARLIPELEELKKELDPFLAKIIGTSWGNLQIQYNLNATWVSRLHGRAKGLSDLLEKAPEALCATAQGKIPYEARDQQGYRDFSLADLTEFFYGEGLLGVTPGRHPQWRARVSNMLALYRNTAQTARKHVEEITFLLGELERRVKARSGAPAPQEIHIDDRETDLELHPGEGRCSNPNAEIDRAEMNFDVFGGKE